MTALNSEGLEKARCATAGCDRPATQRFEAGGVGSDHCDDCAEKIRAARPALPPVDGLEVVANLSYRLRYAGATLRGDLGQTLMDAADALSQASSVIAGLKAEIADLRDEWQAEYDARLAANTARRAAEARISSLEEEIKRLKTALKPFAFVGLRHDLARFDEEAAIEVHFPRTNSRKAIPCAWISVEDVLRARQVLEDHTRLLESKSP